MRLATLDLATTTGVAVGAAEKRPRLLHFVFVGKELEDRLWDAFQRLEVFLLREKPDTVIMEAPILMGNPIGTTRLLQGLTAVVGLLCKKHKIALYEASPLDAKKALSLNAGAKKHHQVRAARLLGYDPECDDEADALGLWIYGISEFDLPQIKYWRGLQNTVDFQRLINDIVRESAERKTLAKTATHKGKGKKNAKSKRKTDTTPRLF